MKRGTIRIIFSVMFFLGLVILLYPMVSQYWNSRVQSEAVADYEEMISKIDVQDYRDMFIEADSYNQKLFELEFPLIQYKNISDYSKIINVDGNGMIGYITIDKLKVELPIYHGTSSSVLNVAVGHLKGSSLPVGGESTHSVLSAHTGLPSAKLFTNLNKLEIGDTFVITVLDRKLTYQVDKIVIVEPNDVSDLAIIEGSDYVTLLTCTPYGLNTHRLLVRGVRVENGVDKKIVVTSDAYQVDRLIVAVSITLPILFLLVVYVMIKPVKRSVYEEEDLW